jgi:hypothetical protein
MLMTFFSFSFLLMSIVLWLSRRFDIDESAFIVSFGLAVLAFVWKKLATGFDRKNRFEPNLKYR